MSRVIERVRARFAANTSGVAVPKDAEDYVRMAYLVLLRRPVDETGLRLWRERIASGRFAEQQIVDAILASDEYLLRFGIDIIRILHDARRVWIKTIPAFDRVLDIGGSSPDLPEGALIQLGYAHRPTTIDILDLPPENQYWGTPKYDQSRSNRFDWGTVSYFHGSGERIHDVAELQGRTYDMVYLGQAIEHIYPESLPALLAWIKAHLAKNGRLVFDTPNRLLTKIQCPGSLTDPDHKHEYTPTEMEQILVDAGFEITRRVGMVHLPVQAMTRKYNTREFASASPLSDDVDACYLFALEAIPA